MRSSIRKDLTVRLSLVIGFVGLAIGLGSYAASVRSLERELHKQAVLRADLASDILARHLWTYDVAAIREICRLFSETGTATGISVQGERGEVIFSTNGGGEGIVEERQLTYEGHRVGTMSIAVSLSPLAAERRQRLLDILLLVLVTAVAAMVLLRFFLRAYLAQPLAHLRRDMEDLTAGRYAGSALLGQKQEVQNIVDAFNTLAARLTERETEVQDKTRTLLEEVAERKKAEAALRQQLEVNYAISSLSKKLIDPTLTLDDIALSILDCARSLTGSAIGSVEYLDQSDRTVVWRLPLSGRQQDAGEDAAPPQTTAMESASGGRLLSLPVAAGDRLLGRITLADPPGEYGPRDVEILERIAKLYSLVAARQRASEERQGLEEKLRQTQKLESLGILAGGIAHDFNNLLVGILGNLDLALAKVPPESPLRPQLVRADAAAQRAAELTNQMLAYSGKGKFVVEPVDISRLVEEMAHLLETVIAKTVTLRYELPPGLPLIKADATQLRQVVMNMITNASDAQQGRQGTVTVKTGTVHADRAYLSTVHFGDSLPEGDYVYLEVADTGCGMDRDTSARIFDPFFTTKQTGRGLGLAAVLGIVRGHRGALKVYSEPGQGTSFKVYFPAAAGVRGESAPIQQVAAAPPRSARNGTILVVDDEPAVRSVAREMLEGQGFAVLSAADGVEGVELFRRHADEIMAVVLDMMMPRMGGEAAYREMRKTRSDIPVILSSGYNEQDAINRFAASGAAAFVQKPYRTQTLVDALSRLMERTSVEREGC